MAGRNLFQLSTVKWKKSSRRNFFIHALAFKELFNEICEKENIGEWWFPLKYKIINEAEIEIHNSKAWLNVNSIEYPRIFKSIYSSSYANDFPIRFHTEIVRIWNWKSLASLAEILEHQEIISLQVERALKASKHLTMREAEEIYVKRNVDLLGIRGAARGRKNK